MKSRTMDALQFVCVLALAGLVNCRHVYEMEMLGGTFSWNMCNKTAVPIAIKKLSISPDIIQFGQKLKLTADVLVTSDVGNTKEWKVDLKVEMNIGDKQWYDLCNYDQAYCHYDDLCELLDKKLSFCPALFKDKWNCKCPLKKNDYAVTNIEIPIPTPPVTFSGNFNLTMNMSEQGKEVGCLQAHFCIGSCSQV